MASRCPPLRRALQPLRGLDRLIEPKTFSGSYLAFARLSRSRCAPWYARAQSSSSGSGKFGYTPPEPHAWTSAHERESQPRAACRSASDAPASTTTSCLSRNRSAPVGERRGAGGNAVVRAGPGLEVQHARFPLPSPVREARQELRDHVGTELAPKELRLEVRVAGLALDRPQLAGADVVLGEVALDLAVGAGHVVCLGGCGAGARDELVERRTGRGFLLEHGRRR